MLQYSLEKDIQVIGIKASSFLEGISEDSNKLHSLTPFNEERKCFKYLMLIKWGIFSIGLQLKK